MTDDELDLVPHLSLINALKRRVSTPTVIIVDMKPRVQGDPSSVLVTGNVTSMYEAVGYMNFASVHTSLVDTDLR